MLPQHQSLKSEIKLFNTITSSITTLCLTEHHNMRGIAFHEETKSLYFSDCFHDTICQIDLQPFLSRLSDGCQMNAMEKIICGTHDVSGLRDGVGTDARFCYPSGIGFSTVDKNIFFVCDTYNSSIRKVDILTKQVTTVTTSIKIHYPESIHVDRYDNLFVYDQETSSILKVNKEGRTKTIFTFACQNISDFSSFLTLDEKRNVIFHCGTSVLQVSFSEVQFFRFQLSTLHRWNRLFSSFFSSPDKSNNKDNIKKVLLFLLSMEILGGVDHYQKEMNEKKKRKIKIESIIKHAQDRTTLKKEQKKEKKEMPFLKYVFFLCSFLIA